jgi:Glu-tRNA(Gln) amidotransferase subunit E-like FAD-binding protein
VAIEDNEIIDRDEIRAADRPIGDTKAAAFVEKSDGSTYEYQIDLDAGDLEPLGDAPPAGAI